MPIKRIPSCWKPIDKLTARTKYAVVHFKYRALMHEEIDPVWERSSRFVLMPYPDIQPVIQHADLYFAVPGFGSKEWTYGKRIGKSPAWRIYVLKWEDEFGVIKPMLAMYCRDKSQYYAIYEKEGKYRFTYLEPNYEYEQIKGVICLRDYTRTYNHLMCGRGKR